MAVWIRRKELVAAIVGNLLLVHVTMHETVTPYLIFL